jgi:anti-anti-sigma factor
MALMASPPEDFSMSADERGGRLHISLRGELDLATAPEFEALLQKKIGGGQEVVVDLRSLEFMDSSGIRVLVAAHARAGRLGTRVVIVRPPRTSPVAKIIQVSGLDDELNIVDDPAQAA